MSPPLSTFPLFDATAFARRLQAAVGARGGSAGSAAREAGVDAATFARAMNGHGALSYENFLRLDRWLAAVDLERSAA